MFSIRNKKENKEKLEGMNLASKEAEILDSYQDEAEIIEEVEEVEEVEEPTVEEEQADFLDEDSSEKRIRRMKIIINIVFAIIMIVLAIIAIDVICVARFDKGPFFAIPLKEYKDGGTKEYYGIGYKVIQYNQIQGRRDKEVGFWTLKYNTEPITVQDIDLAIEMTGNETKTYEEYYKKFVRVISTLQKKNTEKNQLIIGYKDEEGKYSLDIVCNVVKDHESLKKLEEGKEITIIGTVTDYKAKTEKKNNRIYIDNCFAEQ